MPATTTYHAMQRKCALTQPSYPVQSNILSSEDAGKFMFLFLIAMENKFSLIFFFLRLKHNLTDENYYIYLLTKITSV